MSPNFFLIYSCFFLLYHLIFIALVSINVYTKTTNYKIPRYVFSICLPLSVSHKYSPQHILYETPLPAFHSGAKYIIFGLPSDFYVVFRTPFWRNRCIRNSNVRVSRFVQYDLRKGWNTTIENIITVRFMSDVLIMFIKEISSTWPLRLNNVQWTSHQHVLLFRTKTKTIGHTHVLFLTAGQHKIVTRAHSGTFPT